jgi:hypothetical protein
MSILVCCHKLPTIQFAIVFPSATGHRRQSPPGTPAQTPGDAYFTVIILTMPFSVCARPSRAGMRQARM